MERTAYLVRYLAVGVLNTCVGLGIIYLCLYALRLDDAVANLLGYLVGIVFSFSLNKLWTFKSAGSPLPQFARFLMVTGSAYLVNLAFVMVLIKAFGANHYLAQALGTIPYTAVGYLGSRHFAFSQAPGGAPAGQPNRIGSWSDRW